MKGLVVDYSGCREWGVPCSLRIKDPIYGFRKRVHNAKRINFHIPSQLSMLFQWQTYALVQYLILNLKNLIELCLNHANVMLICLWRYYTSNICFKMVVIWESWDFVVNICYKQWFLRGLLFPFLITFRCVLQREGTMSFA